MAIPVSLGMPAAPPPVLAPRRKTRQLDVGGVGVGSDFPVSVQSMMHDQDRRHQRDPAADRRADRVRLPDRAGRGARHRRRRGAADHRQEVADPGDRRHPLPAAVRVRRHRRRLRRRPGEPGQHQEVRRQGRRDRAGREGRRHPDPDRRQRRLARQAAAGQVRQGDAGGAGRVRAVGVLAVRGARLPRHQDLGQAQRPGGHGAGLRAARRAVRLPAAPGRHRGRPGLPGHDQVRRRVRRAAVPGHRRHDPGLPLRAAGRGGQGRHADPGVAEPAPARPGDRLLPVLRARPGRRLQAGRTR